MIQVCSVLCRTNADYGGGHIEIWSRPPPAASHLPPAGRQPAVGLGMSPLAP